MTLSISFYNNVKYTKDDFMNRDRDFFGNGVVNATDFPITFPSTPNMTFTVGQGTAWVDGYRVANDANPVTLTVQPASTQPRIDIVQIGHDDFNSVATLVVKQGIPEASPIEPDADAGYLKLYAINVGVNATSITSQNLNDRRSLVPLKVSGTQIGYGGTAGTSQANSFTQPQTAPQWISNAQQGIAPLQVSSSTVVQSLNADLLDGLHADGVVGQRIQVSNPAQDQYYLVGVLPVSGVATYDKLMIEFQGGPSWDATALINDWVIMGNRDISNVQNSKFTYQYMQQGSNPGNSRGNLRIVAFKQSDGSVQVYLRAVAGTSSIGIVAAYGASVNSQVNTAIPIGSPTASVPTGTIVFDSGSYSYPPNAQVNVGPLYSAKNTLDDGSGNVTLAGSTSIKNSGTATSGSGYGSNLLNFLRSTWNGSSAVTGTTSLSVDNTGTVKFKGESGSALLSVMQGGALTSYKNTLDDGNGAATFAGLATFNGGLTIPLGKTLINNGMISGGTINATSVPWSGVSGTPTTVNGYGITGDSPTWTGTHTFNNPIIGSVTGSAGSVAWANVTGVPSDLAKTDVVQTWSATQTFSIPAAFSQTSGTAPFTVTSNTQVNNLNAQYLNGIQADGVVGQRFVNTSPAQDQWYLVQTLPVSGTTNDKLIIELMGGPDQTSAGLISDVVIMGNRGGFAYQYSQEGIDTNNSRANFRLVAYKQADNSVQVYLRAVASTNTAAIVSAYGIGLTQTTTAIQIGNASTTAPSGTVVFDSGSASYPANANFSAGAASFNGTITANAGISVPTGQNITVNGSNVLTTANKAAANGVASLDGNGQVPLSQLGNVPPSNTLIMPNLWIG